MAFLIPNVFEKKKVVFIMGATATGKSKLAVDLARHFVHSEIINSDKIQVYKGLEIVTNKITREESCGIKHHLLGEFDPDSEFSARDFCDKAHAAIEKITKSQKLPIIVGGSNSYIEALVEEHYFKFKSMYDPCFIQVDVTLSDLYSTVSKRVDHMVLAGLVEEVRGVFKHGADNSRGIRRAIGVPELDAYFEAVESKKIISKDGEEKMLRLGIEEIKINTCELARKQTIKIQHLRTKLGWNIHRIDATRVHAASGDEDKDAWEEDIMKPSLKIINDFFNQNKNIDEVADEFLPVS